MIGGINRRVTTPHKEQITVRELNEALESFAERYLRGALLLTVSEGTSDSVEISLTHTAYMLRLVVESGRRDEPVSVNISLNEGVYAWRISFGDSLPSETALYKIEAAAREAGFAFKNSGSYVTVGTSTKKILAASIYAVSSTEVEAALKEVFLYS